jgi:hypothetical protein
MEASVRVGTLLPAEDRPAEPGGSLLPLEVEMIAGAAAGELVDRGAGPSDLAEMQTWGQERTVRAEVLQHLLVAGEWPVHAKGVRLRGVRISGHLDLKAATLAGPLSLDGCYLDAGKRASLDYATASLVTLTGCQLAGLTGRMLTARELDLRNSTLARPLSLRGAVIGQLICGGAQLNGHGYALTARGMKVSGIAHLDDGFTAAGAIRLSGAEIGQLRFDGARLAGRDGHGCALIADGMKVSGNVYLNKGFTAAGAIRLSGAEIGQLICDGAQLTDTDRDGYALTAHGMKASGNVYLNQKFTAAGTVSLTSAHVGGSVRLSGAKIGQPRCDGARLTDTDRDRFALNAARMEVSGNVYLDEDFTAAGTVSLASSHVGGSVVLAPAEPAGTDEGAFNFTAIRAQIAGALRWRPTRPFSGRVNLEGATVGQLEDNPREDNWRDRPNGYWPADGRLRLDGFTYGRFGGRNQPSVDDRLKWIRGQYQQHAGDGPADFATQPYEQLAAVYRQAGLDGQARKVAIARRADLRKYGDLTRYRRLGNWFLDWSIQYGYQTWRAVLYLAALFMVFLVLSIVGQQQHVIVPIGDIRGLHPVPSATECTSSYPCFYPAGYAVDTVIPIINVHQADNWGPDGSAPWGQAFVVSTWIATGLGWALATLLVAGYTGLVRRD